MKLLTVLLALIFVAYGTTIEIKNVCDTIPSYSVKWFSAHCWFNPTLTKNTAEIIIGFNYTLEEYNVTTKDGYILTMQRIPHNRTSKIIGRPIFMQHGAFCSSEDFIAPGKKSLALILSDMGFDVWLGNSRGTFNSPGHVRLKTNDKSYWKHTVDDMANYDLPACIDKIVEVTERPGDIIYLGHSQGSATGVAYAILHSDDAAKKLKALFFIGPAIYINNLPISGFNILITILDLLYAVGVPYVGINQKYNLLPTVCAANSIFIEFCKMFTDNFLGKSDIYPPEQIPILLSFILQRESLTAINQLVQFWKSGNFTAFDYGEKRNLEVYHSEHPPPYDLSKIKLPIFLFRGENDNLAPLRNTQRMYDELKAHSQSSVGEMIVRSLTGKPFNHMNFMYANNLKEIIVEPMMKHLSGLS